MKKILISFSLETINFRYKIDKTKQEKDLTKTLMNTNVISNDELIFSDSYLKANSNIMSSFLSEIIKDKKVKKIVVEEFDLVPIVLDITNSIKYLTHLYITPDIKVNYKIYEKLIESSYLKYINCFDIPSFMLEKLCDNSIVVDIRCEIVSISNFIYQNNLINYTKLYYRKTIKIFKKFNSIDMSDFDTFCQINRNLKTIYVYDFDVDMLRDIYAILERTHKSNVKILIYQNLDNTKYIDEVMKELKIINKLLIKNCNSKIKIIYSMDYISKNFIKQLSLTNLRTCLLIVVILEIIILVSVKINNSKTHKIVDEVQSIGENLSDEVNKKMIDDEFINNEVNDVTTSYNTKYEESFDKLLSINSDTKAWLKLNNTSINFPVVQSSDNEFYLNHDFNKESNVNGWVFIDYRNNMDNLDQNTIIYGHNSYGTIMFATLRYVLEDSWNNNPNNLDITFNIPSGQYKARIFSIYVIDNTNDYLYINFSDTDYSNFINLIKGRSIKDFGVDYTIQDKMITLSTCNNKGNKRLVVHAKIM